MANRLLLQTLLKFSDQIKSGAAKVQDVITDYFNTTGKSVTDEERSIILKEFQDNAPSNVEPIDFGQNIKGIYDEAQGPGAGDAMVEALKSPGAKKSKEIMEEMLGVTLRGDETFGELMEMKNALKTKEADKGLGSLYPRGEPGEIFDIQNDKRREVAEFMKAMRAAGIKNEDVMKTAKIKDVAEGKRAATTLARAADMGADTKIKQELLGTLDEDIATNSPRFFQEEYMGYDSMGNLLENITTTVNNGIYDDLIEQGVPEDKVSSIFRYIASVRDNMKYDPKAVLRKIADDVEMEGIKYDTTFWDNYIDEILTRIQKPAPRFADGGLV